MDEYVSIAGDLYRSYLEPASTNDISRGPYVENRKALSHEIPVGSVHLGITSLS